jgi:hypothetical protein
VLFSERHIQKKKIKALRICPSDASISNALRTDEEVWQPVTVACASAVHIFSFPLLPQFLATDPEVPGSIPGATRFSEK